MIGRPYQYEDEEIVAAYKEHGTIRGAAKSLGCNDGTVANRLMELDLYQRKPSKKGKMSPQEHSKRIKAFREANPELTKLHYRKAGFRKYFGMSYKDAPEGVFELYCNRLELYQAIKK